LFTAIFSPVSTRKIGQFTSAESFDWGNAMCGALRCEVTLIGIVRRWSPAQPPCSLIQRALIYSQSSDFTQELRTWHICFVCNIMFWEKSTMALHLIPSMVQISAGQHWHDRGLTGLFFGHGRAPS
jgi:hypothetical protein